MRKTTSSKFKPAIAYRRVSTDRQGVSGVGLEGQRVAIETFARREHYEIIDWYQDIASGHGKRNLEKRPGLLAAIEQAKALGVPILVNDGSRISRVSKDLMWIPGVQHVRIISTTEGVLLDSILASSAARAEHERQKISENTSRKLRQLKAEGVKLGNPTNLPEAQKKGAAANRDRAREVAEKIASVLEDAGGGEEMTAGQIVDILNERGIKTGGGRMWTKSALRRPLGSARELLKSRAANHYAGNPDYGRF